MKATPVFWAILLIITIVFLVSPVTATKPVASYISNVTSGSVPFSVQFLDSSLNSPTSWTWLFGDGGTSTNQNPTHTYTTSGDYTVTLISTNADGSDTLTKTEYITATKAEAIPTVSFVANITTGNIPLAVQFLDSSTNNPIAWAWSFGDGGTSTIQNPVHIYTSSGYYTVTLTATNSAGSDTKSQPGYITATDVTDAPDPLFKATTTSGNAPLNVQFVDASDNSPTSWVWSFGDGSTSTLQNPSHTYTTAGSYTVTLTAINAAGGNTVSQTGYITVTAVVPVSSFTANVTSGVKPLTVQFTDTSENAPTGWYWKFGDGGTSTSQNPVYTYNTAGTYAVSLGTSNTAGSNTTTVSGYITVTSAAITPVASFTSDVREGNVPLTVQFTDTSTHAPTSWKWSFGDGVQSTIDNPSHTYSKDGTYTVTLTVSNAAGSNTTAIGQYISAYPSGSSAGTTTPEVTDSSNTVPTQESTVTETTAPSSAENGGSGWILPLVGVVVLVLVIIALVLHSGRSGGRRRSGGRDL